MDIAEMLEEILRIVKQIRASVIAEKVEAIEEKDETIVVETVINPDRIYKIANTICNKCNGLISWDDFDKQTHPFSTHVDGKGKIIDDGDCPVWRQQNVKNSTS